MGDWFGLQEEHRIVGWMLYDIVMLQFCYSA